MKLAARAETWLRVCAGELIGPRATTSDEVDPRGFLVLCSVAHALAVLDVLDPVSIDSVFADFAVAAGIRGRKVASNVFRSGEGLALGSGASAAPRAPWPPEVLDAGACLKMGDAVVQVLWLVRTAGGTWAPIRVRVPGPGAPMDAAGSHGAGPVPPLAPGVPLVGVVDDADGVHYWAWLAAQSGEGRYWGTGRLVPDLPTGVSSIRHRGAGSEQASAEPDRRDVTVRIRPPPPAVTGLCEDDGRSPAERYLDWLGPRGWSGVSRALDDAASSLRDETRAAFVDLGLVKSGFVPRAQPSPAAREQWRGRGEGIDAPVEARAVAAELPLEPAMFVEGVAVDADRVMVHVRRRPGESRAQTVWWQAVDGTGTVRETEVLPGWHGGLPGSAGIAIPFPAGAPPRELRLIASTPLESAFVDLEVS